LNVWWKFSQPKLVAAEDNPSVTVRERKREKIMAKMVATHYQDRNSYIRKLRNTPHQ